MMAKMSPRFFGFLGLLSMAVFYYALLAIVTGDPVHPFVFFGEKWYFLGPLFLGFGMQMYLFQKVRLVLHTLSLPMAGASAGTSGVAMAACCVHHLADILPILGFMGAAAVITQYQDWFLALGVVVNIAGAVYMLIQLTGVRRILDSSSHPPSFYG